MSETAPVPNPESYDEMHYFDDPLGNTVKLIDDGKTLTATTLEQDSPLAYVNGKLPDGSDDYFVMSVGLPQSETVIDRETGKVISDYKYLGKEILVRDREDDLVRISERQKGIIKAKTHSEIHHADYPPTRLTTHTKFDKKTGKVLDDFTSMDI